MNLVQRIFAWLSVSAAVVSSASCEEFTPVLPKPTSQCPTFQNGYVTLRAAGIDRRVLLYMDATKTPTLDGPLVIYFYSTAGVPEQAVSAFGTAGIKRITDAGGIVAAPQDIPDPGQIFPWIQGPDDIELMDEIVACAKTTVGIDSRRIHVAGFSAGALYTTTVSFRRSSYVASAATYSGGGTGTYQEPNNKYPAMIFYGGPNDTVIISFAQASNDWYNQLIGDGHWAALCNHNGGHSIPSGGPAAMIQFFLDHPFRLTPEPYLTSRPSSFPSYCVYPGQ